MPLPKNGEKASAMAFQKAGTDLNCGDTLFQILPKAVELVISGGWNQHFHLTVAFGTNETWWIWSRWAGTFTNILNDGGG